MAEYTTFSVCDISSWIQIAGARKEWDSQDAWTGSHRISSTGVGIFKFFLPRPKTVLFGSVLTTENLAQSPCSVPSRFPVLPSDWPGMIFDYSPLKANNSYWEVPTFNRDVDKTNSLSNHWLLQSICIPLGLRKAKVTFRRVIRGILSTVEWQLGFVYHDDIGISWKSQEAYMKHVKPILTVPGNESVCNKLEKCKLFFNSITTWETSFTAGKWQYYSIPLM